MLGAWRLRSDPVLPNRRVNSTWAIGDPGVPIHMALERVRDHYEQRGRRPIVLTEPGSPSDLALGGWDVRAPTLLMVRPAEDVGEEVPTEPLEQWAAAWASIRGASDHHRTVLVARLRAAGATTGVVFRRDDEPIAVGLGVRTGTLVGIFNVATIPDARRQGLATAITKGLVGWASAQGATHAYLQVEADNSAALALYDQLGFATTLQYLYRVG